jgi:hemerythrin
MLPAIGSAGASNTSVLSTQPRLPHLLRGLNVAPEYSAQSNAALPPSSIRAVPSASQMQPASAAGVAGEAPPATPTNIAAPPSDEDDEDAEAERAMGFVRNAVEDVKWEGRFDGAVQKLQAAYKQLPVPITGRFVLYIGLDFAVLLGIGVALICVVIFTVLGYAPTSSTIIISNSRLFILADVYYFAIRAVYPCVELENSPVIELPRSTNPVWKSSAHMSGNQTLLMELAKGCADYFRAINQAAHYGTSPFSVSHDPVFDEITTHRLSAGDNARVLFSEVGCYADPDVVCSELNPHRLFGVHPPFFGLSKLLARLVYYVTRLSHLPATWCVNDTAELRYISSAYRYDMREGINNMTEDILAAGVLKVDKAIGYLIITVVVLFVVVLFALCGFALPWRMMARDIREASGKLVDLLPVYENEKEMELLGSMWTGLEFMDVGRAKIIEGCVQLLEAIRRKQSVIGQLDAHKQIMQAVAKEFGAEEKEMEGRNYSERARHTEHHLLLRQRLTLLGDQLRLNDAATTATVRHMLISLFDSHFTDADVHFAETIPASERTFQLDADGAE